MICSDIAQSRTEDSWDSLGSLLLFYKARSRGGFTPPSCADGCWSLRNKLLCSKSFDNGKGLVQCSDTAGGGDCNGCYGLEQLK